MLKSIGASANRLHRRAFSHAMNDIFEVDTTIDVVEHHGSTDPLILLAVLEHHGIPKERVMDWSIQKDNSLSLMVLHSDFTSAQCVFPLMRHFYGVIHVILFCRFKAD